MSLIFAALLALCCLNVEGGAELYSGQWNNGWMRKGGSWLQNANPVERWGHLIELTSSRLNLPGPEIINPSEDAAGKRGMALRLLNLVRFAKVENGIGRVLGIRQKCNVVDYSSSIIAVTKFNKVALFRCDDRRGSENETYILGDGSAYISKYDREIYAKLAGIVADSDNRNIEIYPRTTFGFGDIRAAPSFVSSIARILGSGASRTEREKADDKTAYTQVKRPLRPNGPFSRSVRSFPLSAKIGLTLVLTLGAAAIWCLGFICLLESRRNAAKAVCCAALGLGLFIGGALPWW